MAANGKTFPWANHYGDYDYFESQMRRHGKVVSLTSDDNGVYTLRRKQGDELRVFICECYAFGVAEYIETVEKLGEVNAIIINSAWCGYTPDAKRHCRDCDVGLFKIGEFMGALHRDDYWLYLTETEDDQFRKKGWV